LRRVQFRHVLLLAPLVAAAVTAGCGDDNPTITNPSTPTAVTETFAGTVTVNGAFAHNFAVDTAGSVTAQITALGPDATVTVGFALGTWNGSACQLIIANDAAKVSTVILGTATAPGTLCVRVSDVGQLSAPADYEVRVDHY